MADRSSIEWTDATWNPTRGCSKIAPGCKHCYAQIFAERFRGVPGHPYEHGFDPRLVPEKLAEPLTWKRPRRIFVDSMSDLFHEDFPFEYIAACFGVMAACQQHTFQILTKRTDRALEFFRYLAERGRAYSTRGEVEECFRRARQVGEGDLFLESAVYEPATVEWPLPNVWIGTSIATQPDANRNVPILLRIPAEVLFLSIEPLLQRVSIDRWLRPQYSSCQQDDSPMLAQLARATAQQHGGARFIDWVIVGGESGHGARPMYPDWARLLRDECVAAGVPFFFKQWGEWLPVSQDDGAMIADLVSSPPISTCPTGQRPRWAVRTQQLDVAGKTNHADGFMMRVGKKAAGRLLDGRTWDEFPVSTRPSGAAPNGHAYFISRKRS